MISISETKICIFVYLLVGIPSLLFLSLKTPTFQVPDEAAHYLRVFQVHKLNFFPQKKYVDVKKDYVVGGVVDTGILELKNATRKIPFNKNEKVTRELSEVIQQVQWGNETWRDTRSVSIYPPFFYIPAAVGIHISKKLDLNISESLLVSRTFNVMFGIVVACCAILLCEQLAFIIAAIFLFPTVMFQMASVSQDSLMLPTSALLVGFLVRIYNTESVPQVILGSIVSMILVCLLASSRPPYSALSLLILSIGLLKKERLARLALYATGSLSIILSFSWAFYVANFVSLPFGLDGISYRDQPLYIISNLLEYHQVFFRTISVYGMDWLEQVVGVLGWVDTSLPEWFYYCTLLLIIITGWTYCFENLKRLLGHKLLLSKALILATIFLVFWGVLTVIYISWTPVADTIILGVQGRYFIPLVFASALLLLPEKGQVVRTSSKMVYTRLFVLMAYGVTSSTVCLYTVVTRYYF